MSCGLIDVGFAYDCNNPLQGGAMPSVYLINKADMNAPTISGTTPNLVTAINLKATKKAYKFTGFGRSVGGSQEVIKVGLSQPLVKHLVSIVIFGRSQVVKNTIQNIILGQLVAVTESTKPDSNAFEIYGLNAGLELPPGVINNINENNGAYTLTLATPDGQGESLLPQTFLSTDYATTLAALEALL